MRNVPDDPVSHPPHRVGGIERLAQGGLAAGPFVHLHRYGQEFLAEGEPLRGAVALQHLPEPALDRLGLLVDRVPVQERRDLLAELAARQAQRA